MPDTALSLLPSLLGLLSPLEYFVTVNHSALWQKHVAWALRNGHELKTYITSRYSSNMVLLCLLLAAEISVFFNSSQELSELRKALLLLDFKFTFNTLPSLKFWIGLVLLLDICVTLMGLVATFTLWGMISAISNDNAHCLIRSSLGQYVISLPPRLVVASLYLFMTWILLCLWDLVASPLSWALVTLVLLFFFVAIVIPLSAFGRLILHTGAMAQTPILPPSLETQLLPSGLQASLLLRATHRQRRNPDNVTWQYRRVNSQTMVVEEQEGAETTNATPTTTTTTTNQEEEEQQNTHSGKSTTMLGELPLTQQQSSTIATTPKNDEIPIPPSQQHHPTTTRFLQLQHQPLRRPQHLFHHRRLQSVDTVASEFPLPQASVLNSTISRKELQDLLLMETRTTSTFSSSTISPTTTTMQNKEDRNAFTTTRYMTNNVDEEPPSPAPTPISDGMAKNRKNPENHTIPPYHSSPPPPPPPTTTKMAGTPPVHPNSPHRRTTTTNMRGYHHRRRSSTARVLMEWNEDADVRDLYGAAPPAELPQEIQWTQQEQEQEQDAKEDEPPFSSSLQDASSSSLVFRWSPWTRTTATTTTTRGQSSPSSPRLHLDSSSSFSLDNSPAGRRPGEGYAEQDEEAPPSMDPDDSHHPTMQPHYYLTQPLLPTTTTTTANMGDNHAGGADDEEASLLRGESFLTPRHDDFSSS